MLVNLNFTTGAHKHTREKSDSGQRKRRASGSCKTSQIFLRRLLSPLKFGSAARHERDGRVDKLVSLRRAHPQQSVSVLLLVSMSH